MSYATGERCEWCGGYILDAVDRHEYARKPYHGHCLTPAMQMAECWLGVFCQCCDDNDVFACELRRYGPP